MRWKAFFRRRQNERDLETEIQHHLALETRQRIERGESPDAASKNARRDFGNITQVKEVTREIWGISAVERFFEDVRYGVRLFRRDRVFSLVVLLILILGIGASTTVFSLVNAVLLRDLPVVSPAELVWFKNPSFSYPIFREVREQGGHLFQGFFGWTIETSNVDWTDTTERAHTMFVSGEFYPTLGIQAAVGRVLGVHDDSSVAVISYEAWERRFLKDPAVLGKTVRIERVPFTIIGVTPKGFFGVAPGLAPEVTVPLAMMEKMGGADFSTASSSLLHFMGRLKPGLSIEQANSQLRIIWPRVLETTTSADQPPDRRALFLSRKSELMSGRAGFSRVRNQFSEPLWILMGLVALLLIVAGASLANLWTVRTSARQREISLRLALGATCGRIIRQLFTEGLVVSCTAIGMSLLVADWGTKAISVLLSTEEDPITLVNPLDFRVLGFAVVTSLFITSLLTCISSFRPISVQFSVGLKDDARSVGDTRARGKLKSALVMCQVALAVILVAGAALFARSLYSLVSLDPGFSTRNVLVVSMDPLLAGYRDAPLMSFYERATEAMRAAPGVESVSLSMHPPISDQMGSWTQSIRVDGGPFMNTGTSEVFFNTISRGYFATIGQALLSGRDFGPQDNEASARTCIITESLSRDFFPGQNAIGRSISVGRGTERQDLEIVGIVRDAKYRLLQEPVRRIAYLPYLQHRSVVNDSNLLAEIRTSLSPASISDQVQVRLREIDPSVLVRSRTLKDRIRDSLVTERVVAALAMFLGLAALLLATVSLYGLLAYGVSRRINEIGLRLALGADRRDVLWMVMRQSLFPLLFGLIVGIAASIALGRFAETLLYGLTPKDPMGLGITALVVLSVALAASYLPARRATRVDPMTALRHE